jgi:hypothetical protein
MAIRAELVYDWTQRRPGTQMQTSTPDPSAERRKGLTLRLNRAAWRQLRQLALDDERSAHDLLIEALNDFFKKRGKPPAA